MSEQFLIDRCRALLTVAEQEREDQVLQAVCQHRCAELQTRAVNLMVARKAWEISQCYWQDRAENNPECFEAQPFLMEGCNRQEEAAEMWEEYENSSWDSYYRKAYRGEPLPDDLRRYLRNDGVADWLELGFSRAAASRQQ